MEIEYSKSSVKAINSFDKAFKTVIKDKIQALTKIPPEGDTKRLQGVHEEKYRLRIGKYRIIYKYEISNNSQILKIIDIGSRGDIYK